MRNPPEDEHDVVIATYHEGYDAAIAGKSINDNPYERENHERDTGFGDLAHYYWECGFEDYIKREYYET